jgi:hypothetical protein
MAGYEIFYSDGGHCGRYETIEEAIVDAKRHLNGCRHTIYVDIKRESKACWDDIKPTLRIEKTDNGLVITSPE